MPALSPTEFERLARDARLHSVPRRGVVRLDPEAVTVVGSGWLRIFRDAAFVHDVTLALAGPGELLAPGTLFADRSAESGVEAITPAGLLVIPPDAVARQAEDRPGLYAAFAHSLALRTLRIQRKLEAFSRTTVEARVAVALLEIAEDAGVPIAGGAIRLELPLSQADLAGLAGTTRETCSSVVAAFGRRGLVRGGRLQGLLLLDPAALAELAAVDFRGP